LGGAAQIYCGILTVRIRSSLVTTKAAPRVGHICSIALILCGLAFTAVWISLVGYAVFAVAKLMI
jgi:uncharacterized membrane protein YdcZ (DUF606 family)